ncbi:PH domain-containing protein [Flavobacterium agricola]|uniref:PH domain-containing protein n=1 Tax=Flavobacterium agricola TaxID=2870839 RepID=A0ABY6M1D0_9FLAO|nr:PH domain-containing protein [Flavobacterium agricola]UYW01617.1 PH domain-containing protein [Flavobacterium agricola]
MSDFYNQTVDFAAIPEYQQTQLTPLHSNYKKVVLCHYLLIFLFFGGAWAVSLYFNLLPILVLLVGAACSVLLLIFLVVINLKAINQRGFAFRAHDIISHSGFLLKSTAVVPNNRIQHISINQGLFSRWFNLCELRIYTASTNSSDIVIQGILYKDALRYKAFILNQINALAND